jgi:hypothetical protein
MPDFGSFRGFGEKLVQGQTPTQLGLIGSINFDFLLFSYSLHLLCIYKIQYYVLQIMLF